MNKKILIKVGSAEHLLNKFKETWQHLEQGKTPDLESTLYFESTELLLKTLTPKRLHLLQQVHALGSCSIRALAKALERDYKNVHNDVKALHHVGLLIYRNAHYEMPWDILCTEIPMIDQAA